MAITPNIEGNNMTDQTNAVLGSLTQNLASLAKNDALKGFLPVLDNFLTQVNTNQAGLAGDVVDFNALGPALAAAAPQVGAQVVKDAAGDVKTSLDAAAATAATTPVTVG